MTLNSLELDRIRELINIGTGKSASVLNKIVKSRVFLTVPNITILSNDQFEKHHFGYNSEKLSTVTLNFKGEIVGKAEIVFPVDSAVKIVDLLTNSRYPREEMDKLRSSTLNEVGNIVLNSLIGTISNILKIRFKYTIPLYSEISDKQLHENYNKYKSDIILAETKFSVKESNIEGTFLLFFELDSFDEFVNRLSAFNA